MRLVLLSVLALFFVTVSNAQSRSSNSSSYTTALGVKVWDGGGISLKHFFNGTNNAGELIGYFWSRGARFTGLYEIHGDITGAPGLKWYVGPGAHIGFYNEGWYRRKGSKYYYYDECDFAFGIDGVLGLDYKIKGAPLNLSVDIQPSFEILRHPYMTTWGGFAIRYTF